MRGGGRREETASKTQTHRQEGFSEPGHLLLPPCCCTLERRKSEDDRCLQHGRAASQARSLRGSCFQSCASRTHAYMWGCIQLELLLHAMLLRHGLALCGCCLRGMCMDERCSDCSAFKSHLLLSSVSPGRSRANERRQQEAVTL